MKKTVRALYRFPVKGLSPQGLDEVSLQAGQGFPLDRSYAITDGSWVFDPANPEPRPKTMFLMLAKYERLATLDTSFEDADHSLSIKLGGHTHRFALATASGQQEAVRFFADFMNDTLPGMPQIARAEGHQFTDVSVHSVALMRSISLINLASIRSLEEKTGKSIDPLRFRGNIVFDSDQPWEEFDWLDQEVAIGEAVVKIVRRTKRCAATNVNPETGERDMNIPLKLREEYGHGDLGVYAEVVRGGLVKPGDTIQT
jgi:uncharacterized protein YcbX